MTERILRYPIDLEEYQELEVGWPARILTVALGKDGGIDLWAVTSDEEDTPRDPVVVPIYIVGTGHPMPREIAIGEIQVVGGLREQGYLGTVVQDRYVWHIWTGKQR
jgi:hypothetical protein